MLDQSSSPGTSPSITGSTRAAPDAGAGADGAERMPVTIFTLSVAMPELDEAQTTNFVPAPCFLATWNIRRLYGTNHNGNERAAEVLWCALRMARTDYDDNNDVVL